MKHIKILGSNGMLGRYVYHHFQYLNNYKVTGITRKEFDVEKDSINKLFPLTNCPNVIINCIGVIKPRVDELGVLPSILVNSVFPHVLSNECYNQNIKMIHITTDCVFSGKKGLYTEEDEHDVTDTYGRTKSLGEPSNCTVIRTSIIGEEANQKRSLVEWIKSNKNSNINGFINHQWNGVTCLQLSKVIHKIIDTQTYWNGVRHVFSNKLNKYELLNIINDVYNLNINITPIESKTPCDRSLSTVYLEINDSFDIPDLYNQIEEMHDFYHLDKLPMNLELSL